MQAKIFLFAFLLLVCAVFAHGRNSRCDETPLHPFRGDKQGDKWTFKDGGCQEVAVQVFISSTTGNEFDNQEECNRLCST
uniref:Putative conserved secreted protein n=1 Tax=Ornithodoros turicata TaxID=34597 RepID=A0A2R5LCC9_9ACAR